MVFEVSCTIEQKVPVSCNPMTEAEELVAPINGVTVAVVSGDGSFDMNPDELSFYVIPGATVGDTVYSVNADFDPNNIGVLEHLSDTIVLHATEAIVVGFGFTSGEPVLQLVPLSSKKK